MKVIQEERERVQLRNISITSEELYPGYLAHFFFFFWYRRAYHTYHTVPDTQFQVSVTCKGLRWSLLFGHTVVLEAGTSISFIELFDCRSSSSWGSCFVQAAIITSICFGSSSPLATHPFSLAAGLRSAERSNYYIRIFWGVRVDTESTLYPFRLHLTALRFFFVFFLNPSLMISTHTCWDWQTCYGVMLWYILFCRTQGHHCWTR